MSEFTPESVIEAEAQDCANSYRLPVPQQLAVLLLLLGVLFAGTATAVVTHLFNNEPSEQNVAATPSSFAQDETDPNETSVPFADVKITGKAAYVFDVEENQVLFAKNEDEALPLASVTKLMTTLIAHELLTENAEVSIGDSALRQYGDSGLQEGEAFQRQSLSDLVLLSSSNDGAYALAAAAGNALEPGGGAAEFVAAMNIRAEELGLTKTTFKNPTGLDISATEGGAYGSAKDIATLMQYIITTAPDLLTYSTEEVARVYSEDGTYHDAENTNYYIDELPGLIGSKTGYTDLAGGNLVVAFNAGLNRPIIVVVLGSTRYERFTDVIELAKEAEQYVVAESVQE
jgi:D-alanyl-D-alanine carboxypeptidase (penicillin-binding protein 5/6)